MDQDPQYSSCAHYINIHWQWNELYRMHIVFLRTIKFHHTHTLIRILAVVVVVVDDVFVMFFCIISIVFKCYHQLSFIHSFIHSFLSSNTIFNAIVIYCVFLLSLSLFRFLLALYVVFIIVLYLKEVADIIHFIINLNLICLWTDIDYNNLMIIINNIATVYIYSIRYIKCFNYPKD